MPRRRRLPKCKFSGKVQFRTELDAKIAYSLKSEKEKRREIRAYQCPKCRKWHLTSQEKRTNPVPASEETA